jgi:thioredoxin-like negative regulator of GroEL
MKEKITLFKFWAPWCPHCQAVNRFYPKLVADMSDKFNFEDIDTTAGNNVLAARFGVTSVPTFILWHRGLNILLEVKKGEMTYDQLKEWLKDMYRKGPEMINNVFNNPDRKLNT